METKSNDYISQKKMVITIIKKIIKENKGIKTNEFVATLTVKYPYLSEKNAINTVRNLNLSKQIKINADLEVFLCQ